MSGRLGANSTANCCYLATIDTLTQGDISADVTCTRCIQATCVHSKLCIRQLTARGWCSSCA